MRVLHASFKQFSTKTYHDHKVFKFKRIWTTFCVVLDENTTSKLLSGSQTGIAFEEKQSVAYILSDLDFSVDSNTNIYSN